MVPGAAAAGRGGGGDAQPRLAAQRAGGACFSAAERARTVASLVATRAASTRGCRPRCAPDSTSLVPGRPQPAVQRAGAERPCGRRRFHAARTAAAGDRSAHEPPQPPLCGGVADPCTVAARWRLARGERGQAPAGPGWVPGRRHRAAARGGRRSSGVLGVRAPRARARPAPPWSIPSIERHRPEHRGLAAGGADARASADFAMGEDANRNGASPAPRALRGGSRRWAWRRVRRSPSRPHRRAGRFEGCGRRRWRGAPLNQIAAPNSPGPRAHAARAQTLTRWDAHVNALFVTGGTRRRSARPRRGAARRLEAPMSRRRGAAQGEGRKAPGRMSRRHAPPACRAPRRWPPAPRVRLALAPCPAASRMDLQRGPVAARRRKPNTAAR